MEISAVVDRDLPTVVHVSWSQEPGGEGIVRWSDVDGVGHEAREGATGTRHRLSLVGLRPGTTHELEATVLHGPEERAAGTARIEIPLAPAILPRVEVEGDLSFGGYVLTHVVSTQRTDAVVIWDPQGRPVWYYVTPPGERILTAAMEDDGSLWFTTNPADYRHTMGHVHHMNLDGSVHEVWDQDGAWSGGVPLPDGGLGTIAKAWAPWKDGTLLWDTIEERSPSGTVRRVFDFADWFEPEALCAHWRMETAESGVIYDWTHANGLVLSEDGSAWYLMVRHYDALMRIDRSTGDLVWVMGGPYGEFTFTEPGSEFMHAHTSVVEDDRLLLLDNGNHRRPPVSRVVDYAYDAERRTVTAVREIEEPEGGLIDYLGDVKDLPDGGLLVSWTTKGRLDAYDADGRRTWRLATEMGVATGRSTWLPSLP